MPTKDKTSKPKIKVEEVKEEPEEVTTLEPKSIVDETKPQAPVGKLAQTLEPPKVSSFSQLDTEGPDTKQLTQEPAEKSTLPEPKETLEPEPQEEETLTSPSEEKEPEKKAQISSDEVKEWLAEVRPDTTKEVAKTGGPNTKVVIIVVVILLILGALVGGVFYYRQGVTKQQETTSQPTEETVTSTPTEAPKQVDLTAFSISVLNGSGTRGEAAKVKDALSESGFDSEKVDTGNADKGDYQKTTVSMKKDVPEAVFEAIKEKLAEEYDVEMSEEALKEDSTFDVIIIVGARKEKSS